MKIIPIYNDKTLNKWILKAQQNNPVAQKEIYNLMATKMLGVCRSYVKDTQFAEDCLIKGFLKTFKECSKYEFKGSFEGWVRKIMVYECLSFLRSHKSLEFIEEDSFFISPIEVDRESDIDAQELLDHLPEGYRAVFNLFVLENYSHKEIAKLLNITESTSKSQLFKAKKKLKEMLTIKNNHKNEK